MMQGIITAPMLYAMEEFPQLHDVVDQGFDNPANVELVSNFFISRMGAVLLIVHSFHL
jgi:geranyl diphosphate synthase